MQNLRQTEDTIYIYILYTKKYQNASIWIQGAPIFMFKGKRSERFGHHQAEECWRLISAALVSVPDRSCQLAHFVFLKFSEDNVFYFSLIFLMSYFSSLIFLTSWIPVSSCACSFGSSVECCGLHPCVSAQCMCEQRLVSTRSMPQRWDYPCNLPHSFNSFCCPLSDPGILLIFRSYISMKNYIIYIHINNAYVYINIVYTGYECQECSRCWGACNWVLLCKRNIQYAVTIQYMTWAYMSKGQDMVWYEGQYMSHHHLQECAISGSDREAWRDTPKKSWEPYRAIACFDHRASNRTLRWFGLITVETWNKLEAIWNRSVNWFWWFLTMESTAFT